jgi:hypothetical protein
VKKIRYIQNVDCLRDILSTCGFRFPACPVSPHLDSLFTCIENSLINSVFLQTRQHRRARDPQPAVEQQLIQQPHIHPLPSNPLVTVMWQRTIQRRLPPQPQYLPTPSHRLILPHLPTNTAVQWPIPQPLQVERPVLGDIRETDLRRNNNPRNQQVIGWRSILFPTFFKVHLTLAS